MPIKVVHAINAGDLIASLAGIKHLCESKGDKAIIYQQLNRPGEYYPNAFHPIEDDQGRPVCMNEKTFDMLRPLLLAQDYIEGFEVYTGQQVDYDLDAVRLKVYCGAPHYPLQKWLWMAYPEMATDLSRPWLKVDIELLGMDKILVNFTERYRNYAVNYFFLKQYESDLLFVGTDDEYKRFKEAYNLDFPKLIINDFYDLALALKSCRFFLGNQSMCWNMAEAMKVPRILELFPYAQNCNSYGANGYEYYHQHAVEHYVNQLYNENKICDEIAEK